MKKFFTLLVVLSMTSVAWADEAGDTIVNVQNVGEVLLTENDTTLHLSIKGCGEDTTYCFDYRKELGGGNVRLLEERSSNWDFTLFMGRKRSRKSSHFVTMGGVGFGFVTAVGAPDGMNVDMSSSYEIFADLLGIHTSYYHGRHDFSVGLGIDWRNYRMTGRRCFVKDDDGVHVTCYPEGAEEDFSRIKVFSLAFPFRYEWKAAKKISFNVAAILNLNTYASIKTRYTQDGHRMKDVYKNIRQKPVTVDFMLGARWNMLGLYVKYSPCDVLNKDFGPRFQTLSTGFKLFY